MRIPNFLKPFLQAGAAAGRKYAQENALQLGAQSIQMILDPRFTRELAQRQAAVTARFSGKPRADVLDCLCRATAGQLAQLVLQAQLNAHLGLISEEACESLCVYVEGGQESAARLSLEKRYQLLTRTLTLATRMQGEAIGEEYLIAIMTASQETAMEYLLTQDDSGCERLCPDCAEKTGGGLTWVSKTPAGTENQTA